MIRSAAIVGSISALRKTCHTGIGKSSTIPFAERMVRLPPVRGTWRPSTWLSSDGMSLATRSATCRRTACSASMLTLLRTASSAQSALRPCIDARLRTLVTASLSTFAPRSPVRSSPVDWMGWAEPMLVPGAIASTSAAWATKSPAEAARAPLGYTYTMTGTLELRRLVTISSIEVEIPPGVFMTTRSASAWSDSARLTAFCMYDDITLLMSPLRSACSMWGVAARAVAGARAMAAAKTVHPKRSASRARMPRVWQGGACAADVKRGTSPAGGRRRPRVESVGMSAQPFPPEGDEAAVREAEQLITAANDYERTQVLLGRMLRRTPTEAEIAEKLEWSVDRTRYVAKVVGDARRRHDEELLAFIDPDAVDFDDTVDGE